jgi:sterol-4alpha-carboxylate 3-dehydrogenase (decarboxylating)
MPCGRGGFLGTRIIESLLLRGERNVKVLDNSSSSHWMNDSRVSFICADITSYVHVLAACRSVDVVYFTAALISFTDRIPYQYNKSAQVNILGCDNVVTACIACGVKYLIQTSTFHVTVPYAGNKGIVEVSESDEYVSVETCTSYYAATKSIAEQIVRKANRQKHIAPFSDSELLTISIRPPGIFGAKDHLVVQEMLDTKEYLFLGFTSLMDWSYVENVAYAHLLAEKALKTKADYVSGEAYLISDGKPYLNDDFRNIVIHYGKVTPKYGPQRLVWAFAYIIELFQRLLKENFPKFPPPLSYFTLTAIKIMEYNVTVKSEKAKTHLGYEPVFSVEEGVQLAILEHGNQNYIYS